MRGERVLWAEQHMAPIMKKRGQYNSAKFQQPNTAGLLFIKSIFPLALLILVLLIQYPLINEPNSQQSVAPAGPPPHRSDPKAMELANIPDKAIR